MILVKIIELKILTAVELWRKLQLKIKFFFRIIVGGESFWKYLFFIKLIWRLVFFNVLNRFNLMRVSVFRLFFRWVFLFCIVERVDMSIFVLFCWFLYCLRFYNNLYIIILIRSFIILWFKYLRGVGVISGVFYYDIYS